VELPAGFWDRPEVTGALGRRDIGALLDMTRAASGAGPHHRVLPGHRALTRHALDTTLVLDSAGKPEQRRQVIVAGEPMRKIEAACEATGHFSAAARQRRPALGTDHHAGPTSW
jgi:hypothetical protein